MRANFGRPYKVFLAQEVCQDRNQAKQKDANCGRDQDGKSCSPEANQHDRAHSYQDQFALHSSIPSSAYAGYHSRIRTVEGVSMWCTCGSILDVVWLKNGGNVFMTNSF